MEINITEFYNNAAPMDYSASIAEIGNNAGASTWSAACEDSNEYLLLDNDEKREAFKEHITGYGAWEEEEINSWSNTELNALCIQMVSGDIRDFEGLCEGIDDPEYIALSESGTISGSLYRGDDGRVYYYIGS